jgi:hypothetical protein
MKPITFNFKPKTYVPILFWIALFVVIGLDLSVLFGSWSVINSIDTAPAPIQVSRLARINFTSYEEVVKRLELSGEEQVNLGNIASPFGLPAEK